MASKPAGSLRTRKPTSTLAVTARHRERTARPVRTAHTGFPSVTSKLARRYFGTFGVRRPVSTFEEFREDERVTFQAPKPKSDGVMGERSDETGMAYWLWAIAWAAVKREMSSFVLNAQWINRERETDVEREKAFKLFDHYIQSLPGPSRDLVRLKAEGKSEGEIAEIVGADKRTVRRHWRTIREEAAGLLTARR